MTGRARIAVAVVAALFLWVGWDLLSPRRTDIRMFDPVVVARLDTEMWRSYYDRRQIRLFFQLARLPRTQFHLPLLRSHVVAGHAARAAFVFKRGQARSDYEKALPDLASYYRALRAVSVTDFDVERSAALELEWWIVHREHSGHGGEALEGALADAAAELYRAPTDLMGEHAHERTAAMDIRDTKSRTGGVYRARLAGNRSRSEVVPRRGTGNWELGTVTARAAGPRSHPVPRSPFPVPCSLFPVQCNRIEIPVAPRKSPLPGDPMKDRTGRRDFIKSSALIAAGTLAGTTQPIAPATAQASTLSKGARFREALKQPFHAPVIETVHQARLCEMEGFQLVCVSGQAPSRALGIPDVGLVTMTDLLNLSATIAANTDLPVLADMEDGKGNAMHFYRGIQLFERAGMAGILVEDADLVPHMGAPKGDLVTTAQMVDKIHAAVDARRDQNFVILVAPVGLREGRALNEVFDRAAAYEQAGADAFWFPGLPLKDNVKAAEVVKKPLMSTQGTLAELKEAKVAFAAILDFGMISLGAVRRALQELKTTGAIPNATKEALPFEVLRQLDRTQEVRDRARKYNVIK